MTYDAAGIVCADIERGRDDAVLYQVGAVGKAHQARRVALVRVDGARHVQVLDGGVLDVAEGGSSSGTIGGKFGGDGVAVAEESAAEGVHLRGAIHKAADLVNGDVALELHKLAAVVVAVADIIGESKPIVGTADDVRGTLRAFTAKIVNGSDKWHNLLSTEVVGCGNNGHAFHNELLSIGKGDAV